MDYFVIFISVHIHNSSRNTTDIGMESVNGCFILR
jgi:hypothetical protein